MRTKVKRYGRGIPRVRKPSYFQSAVMALMLGIWVTASLMQGMTFR